MEEPFTRIVSQIFNHWTALRLAVEHSMGGPDSKQAAQDFLNYVVQYCLYENNVNVEGIQDALEDILDEEFETVCQDDSPKEIAQLLFMFLTLLKQEIFLTYQGKTEECELEFQKLPTTNTEWLNQQTQLTCTISQELSDDSLMEQEAPPNPDGWTEVKSRKKR